MLRSIVPFQLFVFILLLLPPSIGRLAPLANVFNAAFAINPSSLTFEKMLFTTVPTDQGAVACAPRDAFVAKGIFLVYGVVTAMAARRKIIRMTTITGNGSLAAKTSVHDPLTSALCKIAALTIDELRRISHRLVTIWASCCCCCCWCC
jgi:hypothetical protein